MIAICADHFICCLRFLLLFNLIILTLLLFESSSFSSEYFYPVTQTDD